MLQERKSLRDIGLASLTISILTIFPPLLVMTTVNKVLQFHSVSTLVLLSAIMAVVVAYETLLGYARRLIISVVGARLDTKLSLHVFNRLLRLPLDYFERHPAGETMYQIGQVYRVREFLTGKLLTTFLDLITLCVLLPFLFYLNATLAWIVLVCAGDDHADHPGLSEAAAGSVRARDRCRDLEGGNARRDHRRHQDRKGAGAWSRSAKRSGTSGSRRPASGASLSASWPTGRRPW